MGNASTVYLDIPLVPAADDTPPLRLRLARGGIARGGLGYIADILIDGELELSTGLRAAESVFLMVYLNHVSGHVLFGSVKDLADFHRTQMCVRLYGSEGGTNFGFKAWCEAGALHLGFGLSHTRNHLLGAARLDEAGLTGLLNLANAMAAAKAL